MPEAACKVKKWNSWWWAPWSSKHVEWRTTNREIKDSPKVSPCRCLFWNNKIKLTAGLFTCISMRDYGNLKVSFQWKKLIEKKIIEKVKSCINLTQCRRKQRNKSRFYLLYIWSLKSQNISSKSIRKTYLGQFTPLYPSLIKYY